MNAAERAVRGVDGYQQNHRWIGFPFAVVKKFGDDRGGALAALIAYYGAFAVFPLLLLLTTLLGVVVGRDSALSRTILASALADFPIIGDQIHKNIHSLRGSGLSLAAGLAGLVWASRGLTDALQHSMQEIWNVPGVSRPNFWKRLARGGILIGVIGGGLGATTALAALESLSGHSAAFHMVALAASLLVNIGLFLLAFRILTGHRVPTGDLVPGAIVAGVGWAALQYFGGYLVGHQLRHASQVYGFFAVVLGLLSWIYLAAQLTLYSAELNVVRARHLWPRSIVQPPLTESDERALTAIAQREERRPEQTVAVSFDDEQAESRTAS